MRNSLILMVRPDRFELPTFWFVAMNSSRILLILVRVTNALEANAWRTNAAIDERLMKGFQIVLFVLPGFQEPLFSFSTFSLQQFLNDGPTRADCCV